MIVWNEFLNDARVLKEAQTLQNADHQVCIFALHTPGKTQESETLEMGIQVKRVSRSPLWKWRKKHLEVKTPSKKPVSAPPKSLSTHRQLLRLVARTWTHLGLCRALVASKPDVIHAHDVNVLPTAWLASKLSGAKLVYDAHEISTSREGYKAFRKPVGWVEKRVMPRVAGTITTTDMRAKFFARAYKIPRPIVLQNRPRFSATFERSNYLRDYLGLAENWPIVLYQGGLQSGRGLPKLVKAAASVPHCYFVLIGGGRLAHELENLAVNLAITDRVKFIPTVPLSELPLFTASADIGIQPIENTCLNHFSTDSNKVFEYALAGLPVVASDFPEIRKIVVHYQIGEVIKHDCDSELIETLNALVANPARLALYRENAMQCRNQLCWEEQEHKLINLYRNILQDACEA